MDVPRPLSSRYLYLLLLAIAVLAGMVVLLRPPPAQALRPPVAALVSVAAVERGDLQPQVRVTGRLRPARSATLRFEVAGRVAARLVEPGQAVAAGEALVRLEPGDFADAVAQARAQRDQERAAVARDRHLLALAEEQLALQAREVARLGRLDTQALTARSQLELADQQRLQLADQVARLRFAVDTAEARMGLREAELSRAERNRARTVLRAPFPGLINTVAAEVGDYLSPNMPVLELVDTSALDLYVEVNGSVAATLRRGQAITVNVGDETRRGELLAVRHDPDPATHTHAVRVRLDGEGWLPGRLASATFELPGERDALLIPVTAIQHLGSDPFVYLVEGQTLRRVPVTLGLRAGNRVVVRAGLHEGEFFVARDVAGLSDGQHVALRPGE